MDDTMRGRILSRPQDYAWIGDRFLKPPVRQVVLSFHGLGYSGMKDAPDTTDMELSASGALCVFPYYGPWSWMNDEAAVLVDTVLDAVFARFPLDPATPVISTGGSMGGLSALMYCCLSRHTIAACYANCPVCDLPFHATERPDLPRTMYAAFAHCACGVDEAMKLHSPLHQVERLPDIRYLIVHGDRDTSVNKAAHSDKLVALMRRQRLSVEYIEVPGMEHCSITDYGIYRRTLDFVKSFTL
ncbi:MAG: prolyl oligopeptidase family serine peptidase [Clostridia bacterium]|nr:prolyl oligopeptidase family serine peptidase [Clostridia bacterium]